jgi:hypothetical protein
MLVHQLSAQQLQWSKTFSYAEDTGIDNACVDSTDCVYLSGCYSSTENHWYQVGALIAKVNTTGNELWHDTVRNIAAIHSAVSSGGEVFVTGSYMYYSATFNNTLSITNNNNWGTSGFLAKYSANGTCLWARNTSEPGSAIAVGKYYVYVANAEGFLNCYDLNGNSLWTRNVSGSNNAFGLVNNISLDKNENVFLWGHYWGDITFGTTTNNVTLQNNNIRAVFVAKYDNSGNFKWAKAIRGSTMLNQFSISANEQHCILAGSYSNTITLPNGTQHAASQMYPKGIIVKFDSESGDIISDRVLEASEGIVISSVLLDRYDNYFLTGTFSGTLYMDSLAQQGKSDFFLMQFNAIDSTLLVKKSQGLVEQSFGEGRVLAFCNKSSGLYIAGRFSQKISVDNTNLNAVEFNDAFLFKAQILAQISATKKNEITDIVVTVYPNPAHGYLVVACRETTTAKIQITNILGECVYLKHCKSNGELNEQIEMSAYPKGIYLVEVSTEKGKEVRKVVLE